MLELKDKELENMKDMSIMTNCLESCLPRILPISVYS